MTVTFLLKILFWISTPLLGLFALVTMLAAWHFRKDKRRQALNDLDCLLNGRIRIYPWRKRLGMFLVSLTILAVLQGWLVWG